MPKTNTYYWRAVRRLAKRHDIPLSRARRMDWEKEADAERKRRSEAHRTIYPTPKRTGKSVPSHTKRISEIPKRKQTGAAPRPIPSRGPAPKLKIRDYDRMRVKGEEEEEEEDEAIEEWETDWADDYPELDDLDLIEGFESDFEYDDSDKYREPS